MSPIPTGSFCEVCGDRANNSRYGASACLGCTVFFRRSVSSGKQFLCFKNKNCVIHYSYRLACRYCRFHKCFKVGMKAKSIKRRDAFGLRINKENNTAEVTSKIVQPETLLPLLTKLQRVQFSEHFLFFEQNNVDIAVRVNPSSKVKYRRRARAHDVDVMLKLSIKQATDWANRLELFKKLPLELKKGILMEYCLGFLLIDQGYKTSKEIFDQDIWLLQNGSFMHPNHCFEVANRESTEVQKEVHHNSVSELVHCIASPFRSLEIDETECAALKTILALSISNSTNIKGKTKNGIHDKCMKELLRHCMLRSPNQGEKRFGEIILLLSSIRCGVNALYHLMIISDLFDFDQFAKNIIL